MAQLTYRNTMDLPFAGVIYDLAPATIESKVSAEASAEIPFGHAVKNDGTTETGVLLCTAQADDIEGIVVHSHRYDRLNELGTIGIKPKCQVGIMRKGRIWVAVGTTIAMGNRGFWNFTTGKWVLAAVAGQTIDATGRTYFRTLYTGSNGIAVIEVDFTNKP